MIVTQTYSKTGHTSTTRYVQLIAFTYAEKITAGPGKLPDPAVVLQH